MSTPTKRYIVGESIRVWASDLDHLDNGPVTSGATVSYEIKDRAGTVVASGTTELVTNDDWYFDVTIPANPGNYTISATAVSDGATWKGKTPIIVEAY
jgi:hypothetical protein